ncbi:MAG TPA: hypothetical protein VGU22_15130 [Methylomirabilota bacterium]|jgi:hypothetical protein|nr:hypothetical protein [Methylomirabilota bacterium]
MRETFAIAGLRGSWWGGDAPRWGAHASLRIRKTSTQAPDFLRLGEWHPGCEASCR